MSELIKQTGKDIDKLELVFAVKDYKDFFTNENKYEVSEYKRKHFDMYDDMYWKSLYGAMRAGYARWFTTRDEAEKLLKELEDE